MELIDFIIRLLAATAAGGALGIEREQNNKSAGLRTHTLVSVSACMFALISLRIIGSDGAGDPSRVVGQIVTGIGFLGAGVILHRGPNVHGLTTAATIWCSAALGCLSAFGYYWELAFATVLVIIINTFFKKADFLFQKKPKKDNKNRKDTEMFE
jgi:putative Mg2+ transporter-C (MgtC) family protein